MTALERVKPTGQLAAFAAELRKLIITHRDVPPEEVLAKLGHAAGLCVLTQLDSLTATETANILLKNVSEILDRTSQSSRTAH